MSWSGEHFLSMFSELKLQACNLLQSTRTPLRRILSPDAVDMKVPRLLKKLHKEPLFYRFQKRRGFLQL